MRTSFLALSLALLTGATSLSTSSWAMDTDPIPEKLIKQSLKKPRADGSQAALLKELCQKERLNVLHTCALHVIGMARNRIYGLSEVLPLAVDGSLSAMCQSENVPPVIKSILKLHRAILKFQELTDEATFPDECAYATFSDVSADEGVFPVIRAQANVYRALMWIHGRTQDLTEIAAYALLEDAAENSILSPSWRCRAILHMGWIALQYPTLGKDPYDLFTKVVNNPRASQEDRTEAQRRRAECQPPLKGGIPSETSGLEAPMSKVPHEVSTSPAAALAETPEESQDAFIKTIKSIPPALIKASCLLYMDAFLSVKKGDEWFEEATIERETEYLQRHMRLFLGSEMRHPKNASIEKAQEHVQEYVQECRKRSFKRPSKEELREKMQQLSKDVEAVRQAVDQALTTPSAAGAATSVVEADKHFNLVNSAKPRVDKREEFHREAHDASVAFSKVKQFFQSNNL